ncbi:MAG TPA: trigger factor [Solirubrobacteraceae bacterium]|nr:trigger factor [Solirubrobacteraceae bacterium]
MKTTVTELPESRVRVEAEVPADQVQASLERAARQLGREMRVPGFRRGKVPAPVVLRRVGREAVLDEAVRGSLGRWLAEALGDSGVRPVGDPSIDLGELPREGEPLMFSFEIGVLPVARLGEYKGLEVAREPAEPGEDEVAAELEALRERSARLETVDEAAGKGDFVVIDYVGTLDGEPFEGGEGRDQLLELGGGRLIPGFEEQLEGARAGDERTVAVTFPEDYAEHLAGRDAEFAVTVKEVRRKALPELDDAFAEEAAGFDSLDELRDDLAAKLREAGERRAEAAFREAVLDAVVANATIDVPDALVRARASELWERMVHNLSHQGISKDMYLQISGRAEEDLLEEALPDAEQALRREAALRAVIEAEGISPSDGDVLDALQPTAARENTTPEKLRDRLQRSGRLDELVDDLAQRAAVDLLAEAATGIDPGRARAREQIWTPEKG